MRRMGKKHTVKFASPEGVFIEPQPVTDVQERDPSAALEAFEKLEAAHGTDVEQGDDPDMLRDVVCATSSDHGTF